MNSLFPFQKTSITFLTNDLRQNFIVSVENVDVGLETYAKANVDQLRQEFPRYKQLSEGLIERQDASSAQWLINHFTWRTPDGQDVYQIQMYCVVDMKLGCCATVSGLLESKDEMDQLCELILTTLSKDKIIEAHRAASQVV